MDKPYAYADVDRPHGNDIDPRDPNKKAPLPNPYYQVDATHFAVSSDAADIQKAKDAASDLDVFLGLTNEIIKTEKCAASRRVAIARNQMLTVRNGDGVEEQICQCELNYRNARGVAQQYDAARRVAKEAADELMAKQIQQDRCNESAYHIQLEEQARLDGQDRKRKMMDDSTEARQIQAEVAALGDPDHKERNTASQAACGAIGVETADASRALHETLKAAADGAELKITEIMAQTSH